MTEAPLPVARANGRALGLTTALIYRRVSKEEMAKDSVSLDTQLKLCRRYAVERGWELAEEYQDVMTGTRDDRPGYQRLLADIRSLRAAGRDVVVVVSALDRFGRRLMERLRSREELKRLGVATHSVREGGEVTDLVANILAVVAQEEVERLSRRISDVKQHFRGGGWYPVGRCPWGYRLRPATDEERALGSPKAVLESDSITARFVAEAFERVARGQSVRHVVAWLAGLEPSARGGKKLTYAVVRRVLSSPIYLARLSHDPEAPAGRWPALVDDVTYRRVQERIASHGTTPRQASGRYLLTGLLRCPRCGSRMAGWLRKNRPAQYRCNGFLRGADSPDPRCVAVVRASFLEDAVLAEVSALLDRLVPMDRGLEAALRRAWDELRRPAADAGAGAAARIRSLEQDADKVRRRLTNAAELFADGDLDKEGYDGLRRKARTDLDAIEAELAWLSATSPAVVLPPLEDVLRRIDSWRRPLEADDLSARRDVLAMLFDRAVPVRLGRGRYEVELAWTPLGAALRQVIGAA